jgi:hypothetical protein
VTHGRTPLGVDDKKPLDKIFIKRRLYKGKRRKLFGQAEGETLIDTIGGSARRGTGKPNREIINHSHAYKYSNAQMSKDDTRNLGSKIL